ncbi:hypothetical protein [Ochrobactrum sp. S1502_03]|uniref:hypothetical protein n=1 Tax=Ochrobactrum sp. S1502_03 TaxID=3108451 RepID=UPI0037CBD30E
MKEQPPLIDHDENEPKIDRSPFPYWAAFLVVGLVWAGYLYSFKFDWVPLALGGFTGIMLTAWAIEITGNKVPDSWKKKP